MKGAPPAVPSSLAPALRLPARHSALRLAARHSAFFLFSA
jgi:hypothetical protein